MKTLKLIHIHHAFLLKKWHLFLYILLFILVLLGGIHLLEKNQEKSLDIGVVDLDQSKESKIILRVVTAGKLGKDIHIQNMSEKKALKALKAHRIDGYYVFKEGMTKSFYKTKKMPIEVITYDERSIESVMIHQLTESVFSRLMSSMSGMITYMKLNESASEKEMLTMMTDMLITGLDRNAVFNKEQVVVYDTLGYIKVSVYVLSIILFYMSMSQILKMNTFGSLSHRLTLIHFSKEKMLLTRSLMSLFYTALFTIGITFLLIKLGSPFEWYNITYLCIGLIQLLLFIWMVSVCIELQQSWVQMLCKVVCGVLILTSGLLIPTIYFTDALHWMTNQPLQYIFSYLLELLLNNYIIDLPIMCYWLLLIVFLWMVITFVWRYKK